jgi:YHS domain-containing protein
MSFLSRVMRFLFWLLILSWSVTLLRRAVAWMLRGGTTARQQDTAGSSSNQDVATTRRLVRDPVCGVHVAEVLAIPLREGGETLHFCSIACRDQYVGSAKKFAANG